MCQTVKRVNTKIHIRQLIIYVNYALWMIVQLVRNKASHNKNYNVNSVVIKSIYQKVINVFQIIYRIYLIKILQ